MALMFQRHAHNFVRNGYYPTDSETLARILSALAPAQLGTMRIFDPCAGDGAALAECKHHLDRDRTVALGIEYNEERAYHAKQLLDRCIHSDFQQCVISQRSCGLLFLNPPYGDLVADKGETGIKSMQGRPRLEKLFYQRAISALQWGGILVLIIPRYSIDNELSQWITQHLERVQVFLAPERKFQQVVILGIRKRSELSKRASELKHRLMAVGQGELTPLELPTVWQEEPYTIPAMMPAEFKFFSARLDAKQLSEEIKRNPCLWEQFERHFNCLSVAKRRSLTQLSIWHTALALAAGQVEGIVSSQDGRTYLVKGDTYKEQQVKRDYEQTEKGEIIETVTLLDKFVPIIRALDMTVHSATFGKVLTIR